MGHNINNSLPSTPGMKRLQSLYTKNRIAWLKRGALLSSSGVRSVRRHRWLMPPMSVFFILIALSETDFFTTLLFSFMGVCGLLIITPALFTMLEGYKRRDEIDTSGEEGFNFASLAGAGSAAAV